MPTRKRLFHSSFEREKIQVGLLLKLLADHAKGIAKMSPTRIRAVEILLKKAMPDLSSIEHKGETTENVRYIAEMPEKDKTVEDWLAGNPKKPTPEPITPKPQTQKPSDIKTRLN
jgi:hypothetical protein